MSTYQVPTNALSVDGIVLPDELPPQMLDALRLNDQGVLKWTDEAKDLFMFRATCIRKTASAPRFRFHFVYNKEELTVKWYHCAEDDSGRSRRGVLLITAPSLRGSIFVAAKERGTRNHYRIWLGKGRGYATGGWDIIRSSGDAGDNANGKSKENKISKEEQSDLNELPEWTMQQEWPNKDPEQSEEMAFDKEVKTEGGEQEGNSGCDSVVLPSIELDAEGLSQRPLLTFEADDSTPNGGSITPSGATPVPFVSQTKSGRGVGNPREPGAVSIDIYFVDEAGNIVRTKPWDKCSSVQKFSVQVAASRIIESINNEFALLARIDGMEVSLTKHDEDDFESLKTMILAYMAHCGDAKHGIVEITRLTDYTPNFRAVF